VSNTTSGNTTTHTPETSSRICDFYSYFEHSSRIIANLPYAQIEAVAAQLGRAFHDGRTIFLFGNGGSAALASHFACDLGKGTASGDSGRRRFRALSLTDNTALLTAWANDTSYELVFEEQLRNFIQAGDVAFAISGSGSSPNVLRALKAARGAGAINVGLTGFTGGRMRELCDLCVIVPSDNMQIIEDLHLSITHALFTVLRHRIKSTFGGAAGSHDQQTTRVAACSLT
jgi:D-sedoheptulose 7-phosphate isomerase